MKEIGTFTGGIKKDSGNDTFGKGDSIRNIKTKKMNNDLDGGSKLSHGVHPEFCTFMPVT